MKKGLYCILMAFCLTACVEDLTEYYRRANDIESQNKAQKEQNQKQEATNAELRVQAQRLQSSLDSLAAAIASREQEIQPQLVAMAFSAAENPILTEDLRCEILSNGNVECWIPQLVDSKELIPRFSFQGAEVTINGEKAVSGSTKYDFTNPLKMSVKGSGVTVDYTIYVHAFTGLPVMRIDTEDGRTIQSKDYYLNAHMTLTEDVRTRAPGDVIEADLQIKGRGNSTWGLPKKPYRLKFNDKISFFGEPKDKAWVLLANYTDKSMIRNDLALTLGKRSMLDWTPGGHYVELILNGEYQGTYLLCEKVKVSGHRVDVGDDGFLLEVTALAADDSTCVYFYAPHIDYSIEIKNPSTVTRGDADYNYITYFIDVADSVLFSSNFKDPNNGWQKYMDMDSFVDWYLIHEISKNEDSMFHFSTYMHLKRGGKLKMGPIWDFDIAFGNVKEKETTAMLPEGFMLDWSKWYTRLMEDPAFLSRLRQRYIYFYNQKQDYMAYINANAQYLHRSAQENQNVWHTFYHYTYKQYDIWGSYQNEVQRLKEWLDERMEWMKKAYDI